MAIFAFLVLGIGGNNRKYMKQKIIYNDDWYTDTPPEVEEAFKYAVRIKDDLPPPEQLVLKASKPTFSTQRKSRLSALRKVAAL
jgi:hypothetical protein